MWTSGLLKTMKDPKYVIYTDEQIVMIKDMYPKSKYHFLVLPQSQYEINDLHDVKSEHIPLLIHMEKIGREVAEKRAPGIRFRRGYHAKPSMQRLHLHIISNDMISPSLKTKKHYNSFVTKFFIPSEDVIHGLKNNSRIALLSAEESESCLITDLKCHICNQFQKNMPNLKKHLETHQDQE